MERLPELYEIFQGEVANVTDYGAFIKIPGCRKQGLVHRTHMSATRVDNPSEMVDVGEKVWVKVISRETKDGKEKISLSMKVVNQGTGKDLDSNNVVLEQDERKRREFKDYSKQKITLEAVLNTVCKKCGCKGHFAQDCFMQPGGTVYDLVPDEEDDDFRGDKGQTEHRSAKKKKKEKEKKRKKREKEKQDSSSSDSSAGSDSDSSDSGPSRKKGRQEEKNRKTAKKKKRKHKKRKHRD
ncbi:zinc finger CCHC domain-containing protein 17 [Bombina bombina]|uniref:zinc finger CCHC domain-containing protein 17 n=1 Tax=Bombina bombina TaxID=8345 RepID=UPI00235B1D40|nr:zinc finger CCHC domain-containing protein 17 [Bombina bombina]XP_053563077.1 zinc finger CCHC domain-containing protein 17 [Bombina bombina]XP_053563078.1 zinc finger CCHC domain-containing protein 17 [Bombina bombina]